MAWCRQATSHYLSQCGPRSLSPYDVTRPQWVKSWSCCPMRCCHNLHSPYLSHDDVIKWKYFLHYWPFVWGIHRSSVNSAHKGQWRRALIFYLRLNKQFSKQSWGWWYEKPSRSFDVIVMCYKMLNLHREWLWALITMKKELWLFDIDLICEILHFGHWLANSWSWETQELKKNIHKSSKLTGAVFYHLMCSVFSG